jgi:hypothetical protein
VAIDVMKHFKAIAAMSLNRVIGGTIPSKSALRKTPIQN